MTADVSNRVEERAPRACGACSLCCKIMEVRELAKPKSRWCTHAEPGQGCAIYAKRPHSCRVFHCAWLTRPSLSDAWRPLDSHVVLVEEDGGRRVIVHADPDDPDSWRREPRYGDLKRWAREGRDVAVYLGRKAIVVLPDRDVDLGIVRDDEMIAVQREATPFGRRFKAFKMRKPAPARRAARI